MPEYLSPGVYIEEVAGGPRPIQGVGTSTAGFVGLAERGPTVPKLVTSWGDYQRWFGDTLDRNVSVMPYSLRGFFENGGVRAFVARVVGAGAQPANIDLPLAANGNPVAGSVLRVTAQGAGDWGNQIIVRVRTATRADAAAVPPRDWFRLTFYYYRDGTPDVFLDPEIPANVRDARFRAPTVVEDYDNLTFVDGRSNHVVAMVNTTSKLVHVEYVDPATGDPSPSARPVDGTLATRASATLATASAGVSFLVTALDPGPSNVTIAVSAGTNANTFRVQIDDGANPEDYDNIDEANPGDALTAINGVSALVSVAFDGGNPARPNDVAATPLGGETNGAMGNGADGAAIAVGDFIGDATVSPEQRTGLAGLAAIDEIAILVAPDEANGAIPNSDQIANAVLDQCEALRDRFAVLSSPENQGDVQNLTVARDSSYGAIYFPWIRIFDPRTQLDELVPPAGHVAGIYARSDLERGVHKAPANEVVRGIVTRDINAVRKPLQYAIGRGEHDILNPNGINAIRDFRSDGRSIRVWGARTMSSDPLWRYVNVRRLFLFVEESIDEGTQWVVFEPNYEATWARVRQSVTNFLLQVWNSGALRGVTQEEAFFVRCDRTTMTEAEIDAGMLICEVGIAPVKPAEFVVFRIQQKTLEQTA
jgi:phage tail sheath protein FI